MLSKYPTHLPLLIIVAMSFIGCTKEPLVSIPASLQNANEGIIYYLPKNVYRVDIDARLTQCGEYKDAEIIDVPKIDFTSKIDIKTVADEKAAYTARPQTFGDWNDDFMTHFTRSPDGVLLSVNTTNDDKSAEVVSGYIGAAASVALALQTGVISRVSIPEAVSKAGAVPESICKEEYLLALTEHEGYKKKYDENIKQLAQLSKESTALEKEIANTKEAKINGKELKKLLDERDKNGIIRAQLSKQIASNKEEMTKQEKQLTFMTSVTLFDSHKQQYKQDINLSEMMEHMFKKEFLEKNFNGKTGKEILQKLISINAKMADADGNPLAPNYAKPESLKTGWRYNNTEASGFRGIVYRDRKNAYLEISDMQNGLTHIPYKSWVPFIQGGMIGVAPLYNWDGKGSSSVKFDENGTLTEYKADITESAGEKSADAAKAVGGAVQEYSDKSITLETKQAQHEVEMLQLKQQIKELKDKLNGTP